ncbi:hypothetical protein HYPSUDRAFT_64615 [Hypholoma sublateritium FD-334 SS-4]|uniref:WHIM1 domain-containing protein n=1 Tax=Hypholoma sublateritium (strain FD-334 SS-4) TaxID=945553 RepID=A0A0D2LEF8_HYPSF|nr:hypothetical protein HYPSUDRAFT_64615 [Hypholoma sublateritium FD-334 SS-4]
MASSRPSDIKAHVCPPSAAIHPADRWESLFVYSFICKFTNLRNKVEGLETPMDFEEALMLKEPNNIITQVLVQFIVNLKPQTRNLSTDQISSTVASVLSEYFKSTERTIFWNEDLRANIDPFDGLEGGFFTTSWDFKLKILRQLVELQLSHAPEIKATIDNAWGVMHNKHKKTAATSTAVDPKSQERLQLIPIGQDSHRKRYWVADDSPRIYISTNPWKMTATFQTVSSTREEYLSTIADLKESAPAPPKKGQKRTKLETGHINLIKALEDRIEAVDAELARVAKARRKMENKRLLLAQAEIRQTRTRRKTQKPDYVYNNEMDSEDDGDAYTYQEEDHQDDEYEQDFLNFADESAPRRGRGVAPAGTRRSTRTTVVNHNGKREGSSDSALWRGERRSSRLGGPDISQDAEPPRKRARTEDSMDVDSIHSNDTAGVEKTGVANGVRVKTSGAAALKPTEIALEQIAGKKRSKFWVYAVEPVASVEPTPTDALAGPPMPSPHQTDTTRTNGKHTNGSSLPVSNGQSYGATGNSGDTVSSPKHSS